MIEFRFLKFYFLDSLIAGYFNIDVGGLIFNVVYDFLEGLIMVIYEIEKSI